MAGKARTVLVWLVSILLGLQFLAAGASKFAQAEVFAEQFVAWGYAPWFTYVTGGLEIVGGVLALIPALAAYGAGMLSVIMVGAVYTHVSTGIGSPIGALIALAMALLVVWLRWRDRYGG